MYHKSCGSYSLFLNERFFLGKIHDSILRGDANKDKLPHACKALLLTWGSLQRNHHVLSQSAKNPKQTNDQAFEWVLQDLRLKNLCV